MDGTVVRGADGPAGPDEGRLPCERAGQPRDEGASLAGAACHAELTTMASYDVGADGEARLPARDPPLISRRSESVRPRRRHVRRHVHRPGRRDAPSPAPAQYEHGGPGTSTRARTPRDVPSCSAAPSQIERHAPVRRVLRGGQVNVTVAWAALHSGRTVSSKTRCPPSSHASNASRPAASPSCGRSPSPTPGCPSPRVGRHPADVRQLRLADLVLKELRRHGRAPRNARATPPSVHVLRPGSLTSRAPAPRFDPPASGASSRRTTPSTAWHHTPE